MKLTTAITNVNQGILNEDDSKVAANFAVFSRSAEKMLQGFSESVNETRKPFVGTMEEGQSAAVSPFAFQADRYIPY